MIESAFDEINYKNEKNMVASYSYKHPKQTVPDILLLIAFLEKLLHENKTNLDNEPLQHKP